MHIVEGSGRSTRVRIRASRLRLRIIVAAPIAVLAVLLSGITGPQADAINYGSGTYGACQYGACGITISSTASLALNVTPSAGGACTQQSNTVSVLTSNSNGYTLTLANIGTNTSLVSGSDSISATTATQASPAALTANRWGYRIDNLAGFGAGPSSAESNVALNSVLYAKVPASSTGGDIIASSTTSANPAVETAIWYKVCANTETKSGTYTTDVLYTAVTN